MAQYEYFGHQIDIQERNGRFIAFINAGLSSVDFDSENQALNAAKKFIEERLEEYGKPKDE